MTFALDIHKDKWLSNNRLRRIKTLPAMPSSFDNATHFQVVMRQIKHDFHPKLKNIPVLSYGDSSPGALIEAQVNKPVRVSWFNGLFSATAGVPSLNSVLQMGTRQGMEEDHMLSLSHNGVHLHGARVPWSSDGYPEHLFHPHEGRIFYYPNKQAACTLWYHDHVMMVTRLNVYAGLFGLYLLRDPSEQALLPQGEQEIALVLQDKSFSDDGRRLYYEQAVPTPEFIGDYPVVNAQVWPTTKLTPRIYRLRLCNGANTRFFNLSLSEKDDAAQQIPLWVIGTEGGFLPAPAPVNALMMAPGERFDVLIDLRHARNKTYVLHNDAPAPYSPSKHAATPLPADHPCSELLEIKVRGVAGDGDSDADDDDARFDPASIVLPQRKDPLPNDIDRGEFAAIDNAIDAVPIDVLEQDMTVNGRAFKLRRFKLEEYQLEMPTLPGQPVPTVQINGKNWDTAPAVQIQKDAVEVWEFMNTTPDTHPMHIHLTQHQIMSRSALDIAPGIPLPPDLPEPQTINGYTPGGRKAIAAFEQGWKDTTRCDPSESTRLIMKFDGYTGDYVYHCHILEHEDMGMMYKIRVDA